MNEDLEGAQLIRNNTRPQVSEFIFTIWKLVRIAGRQFSAEKIQNNDAV